MKTRRRPDCLSLGATLLAASLTIIIIATARGEQTPTMRPALLGRDNKSLINAIDTAALIKKGQTDATVRFSCHVNPAGRCTGMVTYGGTPNSEMLGKELLLRSEADWSIFTPAIYHDQTCHAHVCGTVIFAVRDGKPHLRIYLHEEGDHLTAGDDFIAPQAIYVKGQEFRGFRWPNNAGGSSGLVVLRVRTDETGKFLGANIALEKPTGKGFGAEVMGRIGGVVFIPAYLHGKPVASTATIPIIFKAGRGGHWSAD